MYIYSVQLYTYSLGCLPDDLDRVIPGSMLGSHVVVHGGDSLAQGHVTVLPNKYKN